MPADLGALAWAWLALVGLGAGFVRGYTGFGFSALILTGAGLALDPVPLIPAVLLCDLVLTAAQFRSIRGDVDWARVRFLLLGCLGGVPLGVWAVGRMGPDLARAAIAGAVLLFAAVLLGGWRMRQPAGRAAHAGVGVVSGVANGAAIGGLPVAAFFAAQPIAAVTFRATNLAYFTALDLWTLPVMAWGGLVSRDTGTWALVMLPVTALGVWAGSRRFLHASPEGFRRLAVLLLIALALLGLGRAAL